MSSARQPYVDHDVERIGSSASGFARTSAQRLERLVAVDLQGIVEEPRALAERGPWVTFTAREPCCGGRVYLNVRARRALPEATNADVLALAQRVRRLEIPAVLPVHRFGVTDELLWVSTLARRGRFLDEPRSMVAAERAARALAFLRQVTGPVSVMHRAGVAHGGLHAGSFHRDVEGRVRVRNVLLEVPILRACLAAGIESEAAACAAPEVREGGRPEPASDQYAIAALVTLIATGTPPAPDGALPREGIPPVLRGPLGRALSRRPSDRFRDVLDLWDALAPHAVEGFGDEGDAGAGGVGVEEPAVEAPSPHGRFDGARFGRRRRRERFAGAGDGEVTRAAAPASSGWWSRALAAATVLLLFSGGVEVLVDRAGSPLPRSDAPTRAADATVADAGARDPLAAELPMGGRPAGEARAETPVADAPEGGSITDPATAERDAEPADAAPVRPRPPAAAPGPPPPSSAAPTPASTGAAAAPTATAGARSSAPGRISLQTYPWGAAYVDGRYIGDTPLVDVRVAAGEHTLSVVRSGHETYERAVLVRPGETLRLTGIVLRAGGS